MNPRRACLADEFPTVESSPRRPQVPEPLTESKLREWMERMGPALIGISTSICRSRARAEEIVQEAFLRLWRKPPDQGEPVYPSWLRTVVANLSINALKSNRRMRLTLDETAEPASDHRVRAADRTAAREDLDRVERALERLDPAKRTIIMLRAQDEMAYEEIAKVLGVPVGTVMSRLSRARIALQRELEVLDREESGASFDIRRYRAAGGA
ncbi:MAG: RNA polymerase sigma factor [Phycisphaerae bacterium]|nr:RNA polymerase sigma factor [Phycisphaerae bacterium]